MRICSLICEALSRSLDTALKLESIEYDKTRESVRATLARQKTKENPLGLLARRYAPVPCSRLVASICTPLASRATLGPNTFLNLVSLPIAQLWR